MQLTKDEINTIWADCQDTGNATRESIAAAVIAAHTAKVLGDVEPFVFEEYPYHCEAMGCGLEDRNITDRYEAMAYGWERAMERAAEAIPDDLYPAHTVAALKSRADALAARVAELERVVNGFSGYDFDGMVEAFDRIIQSQAQQSPFHQPMNSDAMIALRVLKGLIPAMEAAALAAKGQA